MSVSGRRDPKEPCHSFHCSVLKRRRPLTKDCGPDMFLYRGCKRRVGSGTIRISVFRCAHLQHMVGTRAVNGSLMYYANNEFVFEKCLLLRGTVTSVSWCWTDTYLFKWRCSRNGQYDCCWIRWVWFLHKTWPRSDMKPRKLFTTTS